MNEYATSVLRDSAITSGLVSQDQLDDALAGLAAEAVAQSADDVSDEKLAERLVGLGYLNRWQADQLLSGHTRFRLGPYRIVDAIGKGGMGHVFKGEHEMLGRIEAVKVLPASKSTPEAIANFQREIRVQAQLDHPNLVRVSYADRDGEVFFFVTEYVPGTDLRRLVRRHGPLPPEVAASIISQTAEGLHYAHCHGLVHRDIKPGNLLVTPEGHTKLTDLGLAWYLMDDLGPVAPGKPGSIVGTSDYLAPEMIANPDQILPVSDIYALGCTLYYAVTGKVPFPGGSTHEKMRRHLEETPLNPLHFNPDLPVEFCDVLAAMMAKEPRRRVPAADKVVKLLRPWASDDLSHQLASVTERMAAIKPAARTKQASSQGLAETASFDDLDFVEPVPDKTDSPSQISQGTEPYGSDAEDTLTHPEVPIEPLVVPPPRRWSTWALILAPLAALGLGALLALLLSGLLF